MGDAMYLHKNSEHCQDLFNVKLSNKWCDLTIQVNGKEFRGHKIILATNLRYFAKVLTSDSVEENTKVLAINFLEEALVEKFIKYAYTGEMLITKNDAFEILMAADELEENSIKEACIEFLKVHLKKEHAFEAYRYTNIGDNDIQCHPLRNAAKTKILLNFEDLSQSKEYFEFRYKVVVDVLSDGKIQPAETQQILFAGILRWIAYNVRERDVCMIGLLQHINIILLGKDNLMDILRTVVGNSSIAIDMENELKSYYDKCLSDDQKNSQKVLCLIGDDNGKLNFQSYNFTEKKWSQLRIIFDTNGEINSNCALLKGKLYYISKKFSMIHLMELDLAKNVITMLCPPCKIWWMSSLCACSRYLYVCGGVIGANASSDQFLSYDTVTKSFEILPSMLKKRYLSAAVVYQDRLHVLGGRNHSDFLLDSVEYYEPATRKWTELPSMRDSRFGLQVAVLNEILYVCGGSGKNSVEIYDPNVARWQTIANMNKKRTYFVLVALKDKLYAVNGTDGRSVEVFDGSRWHVCQEMMSGLEVLNPLCGFTN